jgi:hypothetical protein
MSVYQMGKSYAAYGLIFESEMDLPELVAADGPADVVIGFGKAPEHLDAPLVATPWYETAPGRFLLRVDGIARYYAENGNSIVIEPCDNADPEDVRLFLLNPVLAALLYQRGYLALNGSVAVVDDRAMALVGFSGVGKSALMLELYDRGCRILDDEICAVRLCDGRPFAFPGRPHLHVWRDTLEKSGRDAESYYPVRHGIEKYAFPVSDRFCEAGVGLRDIILLERHNFASMKWERLTGGEAYEQLMRRAYSMETAVDRACDFRAAVEIMRNTGLNRLIFSDRHYGAGEVADFILERARV